MTEKSRVSYSYRHTDRLPGSSPQVYTARPEMHLQFDMTRDPLTAAQVADIGKSEVQRRREAQGLEATLVERRASFMIARQQPKPVLRPSSSLARGPDATAFNAQLSEDDRRARFINERKAAPERRYSHNREER